MLELNTDYIFIDGAIHSHKRPQQRWFSADWVLFFYFINGFEFFEACCKISVTPPTTRHDLPANWVDSRTADDGYRPTRARWAEKLSRKIHMTTESSGCCPTSRHDVAGRSFSETRAADDWDGCPTNPVAWEEPVCWRADWTASWGWFCVELEPLGWVRLWKCRLVEMSWYCHRATDSLVVSVRRKLYCRRIPDRCRRESVPPGCQPTAGMYRQPAPWPCCTADAEPTTTNMTYCKTRNFLVPIILQISHFCELKQTRENNGLRIFNIPY